MKTPNTFLTMGCGVLVAGGVYAELPKALYVSGWDAFYDGVYLFDDTEVEPRYNHVLPEHPCIGRSDGSQMWFAGFGPWGGYSQVTYVPNDPTAPVDWIQWFTSPVRLVSHPRCFTMEIPDASNPDSSRALTRDPINTISGNMVMDESDLRILCPGIALQWGRTYNSGLGSTNGAAGARWTHSFEWSLLATAKVTWAGGVSITNDHVDIRTGDGRTHELTRYGTTLVWRAYRDTDWTIYGLSNGAYRLLIPPDSHWLFTSNGVLSAVSNSWGDGLLLTYTNAASSNRLTRVEHSCGQYLAFSYQGNRLIGVDTPSTNLYVRYAYGAGGDLTNATVRTGKGSFVTRYAYDGSNHSLTQRVNASGHRFAYTYATNAAGQFTSRCTGMLLETNYYQHSVVYFTNSACSQVTYVRGGVNQVYTNYYGTNTLRITRISGPGTTNISTTYTYEPMYLNITEELVEDKSVSPAETFRTARDYDDHHNILNESAGYCATATNEWQYLWHPGYQTLTAITDPEGRETEIEYTNGSVSVVRFIGDGGAQYETRFAYTTNGLVTAVTNANGHWVRYAYDSSGNPTSAMPQVGPQVFYAYTNLNRLAKIQMPPLTYGGDPGTTNGPWVYRTTEFDTDERGRPYKITYPDASTETFLYDAMGNLTNHVDVGGRSTRLAYAPAGHLTSLTRTLAAGGSNQNVTTSLAYDNQFNSLVIRDPLDRAVETYALDLQDRPVAITNVEGQTMSIAYGLGSFVRSIARFDGTVVSTSYDTAGRLAQIRYADATNSFSYLKNDLLRTASNALGTLSNAYNAANRLTSTKSVAASGTVSYTYFPAGQISNISSVAGTLTYSLDGADRVEALATPAGTFAFTFDTNNGLVSAMQCTNAGLGVSYDYDSLDRPTAITWRDVSNQVICGFAYGYNGTGMLASIAREDGQTVAYTYDSLDRLTGEIQRDNVGSAIFSESISYDLAGNRTAKTRDGVNVSYTRGTGNRLTNWAVTNTNLVVHCDVTGIANEPIGTAERYGQLWVSNTVAVRPVVEGANFYALGFSVGLGTQRIVAAVCDVAGNTIFVTNSVYMTVVTNAAYGYNTGGCVTSVVYRGTQYTRSLGLAWNGQYQLTQVLTNGVVAETHGYDALGRRAYTIVDNVTNWYVWDGVHPVAEVDGQGRLRRAIHWGPGGDNLLAFTDYTGGQTNIYYMLTDRLGTVHAAADKFGAVVESYRYDAWGKVLGVYSANGITLAQSAIGNNYLWTGKWYSWKTGLYYNRARWADPVVGRWLSNDPIGISGGLNQYVFCANNPVNFIDPFGLLEAIASYNYWGDTAVAGFDQGGVGGYAQAAGASVMQAFIDFWGSRSLENNASLSGQYSTSDECQGKAWKHGLFAGGQIALSAASGFGGNNAAHPFYRFVGPGSRSGIGAGTWLARGTRGSIPYGNIENAISRLQIPPESQVNSVIQVRNVWWRYIAGPRPASGNPAWGAGGGLEYRIGGF